MLPLVQISNTLDSDSRVWHMVFVNNLWDFQIMAANPGELPTFQELATEIKRLCMEANQQNAEFFVFVDRRLDPDGWWQKEQGTPTEFFAILDAEKITTPRIEICTNCWSLSHL
jgi:hypothetical protein